MVVLAICWKWPRFAGSLALAYFGILRPGEVLRARRRELVLPEDLNHEAGSLQHATVDEPLVVGFISAVFRNIRRDDWLYPVSPGSFRRRWDALLRHLNVPPRVQLTPGSIRSGGAIHFFRETADISRLMWKMRLRQQVTLENYLQELTAYTVYSELEGSTKRNLLLLADLFEPTMRVFHSTLET